MDQSKGYAKERFPDLKGDSFDCSICSQVCKDPKECIKCGNMYCAICIDEWAAKKNECPIGCTDARNNIRPISGALAKIYKNLDIKCKYQNCTKVVKVCDLSQHEATCQLPKCEFNQVCGNYVRPEFSKQGVCSPVCEFLAKLKKSNGNWKQVYDDIKTLMKNNGSGGSGGGMSIEKSLGSLDKTTSLEGVSSFKWDSSRIGHGIEVSSDKKSIYLKENAYMFRSAITDTGMNGGVHYWEIIADSRTENELKIGVSTKRDFNYDTAFADYEYGFSYYGLGQLRHNSNSIGAPYGKKFKKEGVLGCCLDMNKGTLSFALNGEYWGEAYKSDALKKGPIFAAVSLLHQAGCKLETGKPVPSYFK